MSDDPRDAAYAVLHGDVHEATQQLEHLSLGHAREEIVAGTVALLRAAADKLEAAYGLTPTKGETSEEKRRE